MKANLTVTSKELMEFLEEKYPGLEFDWIWFDLRETQEHWEAVNNKKFKDLRARPNLKQKVIRIWSDGSFEE